MFSTKIVAAEVLRTLWGQILCPPPYELRHLTLHSNAHFPVTAADLMTAICPRARLLLGAQTNDGAGEDKRIHTGGPHQSLLVDVLCRFNEAGSSIAVALSHLKCVSLISI
jgi:hypothetical protein